MVILGHDFATIAERIGVSVRQVRRILAEPDVKAEIRELEGERMRAVARKAAALGGSAVTVLASIAADKAQPAAARVSACRVLLETMLRVSELEDLKERIEQLEALPQLKKEDPPWSPRTA